MEKKSINKIYQELSPEQLASSVGAGDSWMEDSGIFTSVATILTGAMFFKKYVIGEANKIGQLIAETVGDAAGSEVQSSIMDVVDSSDGDGIEY